MKGLLLMFNKKLLSKVGRNSMLFLTKKPYVSVKRARLHIESVVTVPVIVPVPVNIPATVTLLTATKNNYHPLKSFQ